MFDLGFSEIIVIAVVLLIVVGPERLPGVARTAGHLLGRFQRYVADVKADIRREIQVDELKKFREQAQNLDQTLRAEIGGIQAEVRDALTPADDAAAPASAPIPENAGQPEALPEPEPQLDLDLDLDLRATSALPTATRVDKT
ncbi:MAG: Sec-independent protein translocase protein TatB [Azoarcus sp.]|jgi:sec-independent protein translocase protein TatB|nr:Sec-independent protein translocase protein TatB [Azoarcus sp.]